MTSVNVIVLNKEKMEKFVPALKKYYPALKKYYYDPTRYKTYLEQLGIQYPTIRN